MILSETDAKLFFELWLGLLDYVNKKYQVNSQLPKIWKVSVIILISVETLLQEKLQECLKNSFLLSLISTEP